MPAPDRLDSACVNHRVKVLFIAGAGRSGSSLLADMLGQLPGVFTGGELRYLWERGVVANRLCGCGQPFGSCTRWQSILGSCRTSPAAAAAAGTRHEHLLRARALPRLARRRSAEGRWPKELLDVIDELYRAIARQTGCRVVVDSSKLPSYSWLLRDCPSLDVYVVHLVRDPRAVAFSWQRVRELADGAAHSQMPQRGALSSAADWVLWNATTELLWARRHDRYLRVRYEDLVADPAGSLQRVRELMGEAMGEDPVVSDGGVELQPTHSVAGNPTRFRAGRIELRADRAWTHELSRSCRLMVTAVSAPLLPHYRYRYNPTEVPR